MTLMFPLVAFLRKPAFEQSSCNNQSFYLHASGAYIPSVNFNNNIAKHVTPPLSRHVPRLGELNEKVNSSTSLRT